MTDIFRRQLRLGSAVLASALATACAHTTMDAMPMARADLNDTQSAKLGTVKIEQNEMGAKLRLEMRGMRAGTYAMHLHQTGKCDAPKFESAGPHWNPTAKMHGLNNPNGPHAGDLPNFSVDSNGTAEVSADLAGVLLASGAQPVLDADGTALIIHEKPDDNVTDPSGNSGARIICGVLQRAGG